MNMMKYTCFSFFISSFRQDKEVSTSDILYVSPGILRKCISLITCIAVGSAKYTQTDVNFRMQGNRLPNSFFRNPREIARDQRDACTYACMYVCAPVVYPRANRKRFPAGPVYRCFAPLSVHGSAAQTFVQDREGKAAAEARVAIRYR